MNRNHQSLELDKVLELLAAETTCADAAASRYFMFSVFC